MRAMRPLGLLLIGVMTFAAGCGGSGSSPLATPPSTAVVTGSYHYLLAGGMHGPPASILGQWGLATADGMGALDMTALMQDVDDVVSPAGPFSLTYSVDPSGGFHAADVLGSLVEGGVAADGSLALGATARANAMPALLLWLRRSGTFSNASLVGTYHYLSHGAWVGTSAIVWGSITFDGLGGYVLDATSSAGGILYGTVMHAGSYVLAPDGVLTLDGNVQGGLREDGDLALLVFPTVTPVNPAGSLGVVVLVRESVGAGLSSVAGAYHLVGRRIGGPSGTQSVQFGQATVTAPGTLATSLTANDEGTVGAAGTASLGFTVGPSGEVVVLGDDIHVGAVSPDGRFVALVGGIEYGADGQLVLMTR